MRCILRGLAHLPRPPLLPPWACPDVLEAEAPGRIGFEVLRAACAASVPLLLGVAYAWAVARGAFYTITTHRVVLKMGVAFSITLNLPFAQIESAGLLMRRDGSGDIALRFVEGTRGLGWFILWPHARGWRLARGEPMLRGPARMPSAPLRSCPAHSPHRPTWQFLFPKRQIWWTLARRNLGVTQTTAAA